MYVQQCASCAVCAAVRCMYSSAHRVLYVQLCRLCAVCTAVQIVCCTYSGAHHALYVQQWGSCAVCTSVHIVQWGSCAEFEAENKTRISELTVWRGLKPCIFLGLLYSLITHDNTSKIKFVTSRRWFTETSARNFWDICTTPCYIKKV